MNKIAEIATSVIKILKKNRNQSNKVKKKKKKENNRVKIGKNSSRPRSMTADNPSEL